MLGAIIGDICGSVYEFHNQKDIRKIKLFAKGCFPTDDSVMTCAVAQALMDSKGMNEYCVREQIVDAMHYYGHLFPRAGYGGTFARWLSVCDRDPYNSWGNGSGMRVAAVGWLYPTMEETRFMAKLTAEVTHNHPEGIKGAEAIAACIFLARNGASKEVIRSYVEDNFYRLDFTIDGIRPWYEFDVSCQGSCPQAIEAFLESDSFEDAILKAVSVGGDSDTIACMTGGIAEAFYGIPEEMKVKAFEVLTDKQNGNNVYNNSALAAVVKRFYDEICCADFCTRPLR